MSIRDPYLEYRAILCAECGDDAFVVHSSTPATTLEGRRQCCENCGTEGKVVLLDDEDPSLTKLEFRAVCDCSPGYMWECPEPGCPAGKGSV